jgi:ABC-2 type transport system permease protein/sodium transport system permease protein
VNAISGFGLKGASPFFFAAAILLGLSLWPLIGELVLLEKRIGLSTIPNWLELRLEDLASQRRETSPILALLTLAIVPGVVEELFFRGWLFTAMERAMPPIRAIVLAALLFALFHLFTGGVVLVERVLPTALLGLLLGWIRWRSGSTWPGMVMHVAYDGLLAAGMLFPKKLGSLSEALETKDHIPIEWLVGGTLVAALGVALVWLGGKPARE